LCRPPHSRDVRSDAFDVLPNDYPLTTVIRCSLAPSTRADPDGPGPLAGAAGRPGDQDWAVTWTARPSEAGALVQPPDAQSVADGGELAQERRTLDGVAEREGWDESGLAVRGLALPQLLVSLLDSGRWRHPGDDVLRAVVPWFEDPLDFLHSPGEMRRESYFLYEDGSADRRRDSAFFHVVRGSVTGPSDLPWLDVEQAFNIAVNRRLGDDVAIALDYRTDLSDPRVVGSDAWTSQHQTGRAQYAWRQVAPAFSAFAEALGLVTDGR
jgi:hypothetical protein